MFRQRLVYRDAGCTITLMDRTPLAAPVVVGTTTVLEPDAPVVWFTFDGAWHDIGRFHTAAGAFTGIYANILTPVQFLSPVEWRTTDLFLDIWQGTDGSAVLLDEEELADAVAREWITDVLAGSAHAEGQRLLHAASRGDWPPAIVREWPLERAVAAADRGTPDGGPV